MKIAGKSLIPWWQGFLANRKLTYDLVESLSNEETRLKFDRPGLDSAAKQVQEMVAVQHAFAVALVSGAIDFSSVPDVEKFTGLEKAELLKILREADGQFEELLTGDVQPSIRWDDIELTPEAHMCNLISHEVFHQGQLAMASYIYGFRLPDSWHFNWALPAKRDPHAH